MYGEKHLLISVLVTSLSTGLAVLSIFTLGFCPLTYSLPLLIPLFFSLGFLSGVRYGEGRKEIKGLIRGLEGEEKKVVNIILSKGGKVFQSEISREIGAVKATRILRKLEKKGIISREKVGKTYLVVIK